MKVICDNVSEECSKGCDHLEPHDEINCCATVNLNCIDGKSLCIPVEEIEEKSKKKSNVINYQVVTGWDAATLEDGVRLLLSEGWEISGGVVISMDSAETILFCQAMVKYEDVTKD